MSLKGKLQKIFLALFSLTLLICAEIAVVNAAPAWAPNTYYAVGAIVTYNGTDYQCIQAHTSLVGWEPPNVPALWAPAGPAATPTPSVVVTPTATNTNTPSSVTPTNTNTPSSVTPTVTNTNTPTPSTVTPTATNTPTTSSASGIVLSINGNVLTWTDSAGGNDYHVYKNGGWIAWTANRTYTISGAVTGDAFYVTNGSGSVKSNTVTYGVAASPSAPPTPTNTPTPTPTTSGAVTPTPTATLTIMPTPSNVTQLPKRIMVGYWHTWNSGCPFIKLRDVNPNWDVINISFAEPVTPGSTNGDMKFVVSGLTADYTINDFKADINLLKSQGKKIVLAIGGYEGYFSLGSSAAVTTFVNDIKSFINEYGFDGIDIDLEQSSVQLNSGADPDFRNPTSPKVVNMISAIRQICDSYGPNFILSWAPETFYLQLGYQYYAGINSYVDSRAGVYIPMIHALRDKTTYVQAQLYNSGPILAPDGQSYTMGTTQAIVAMCKMLLTGFNVNQNANYFFPPLRPDQVVIAVPASSSAAGSGQISNAGLQSAFSTLNATYPNLRGIMAWSINWDAFQNNNSFVISNRSYLNSLP